jgi:hypothetical protein
LLAGSQEQYLAGVTGFVRAARARGEPVLVAVPAFRAGPLRQLLGASAGQVTWADMANGARGRTSCKRQVSGSIPLTGSVSRGRWQPSHLR